jgi:hypothetical protein
MAENSMYRSPCVSLRLLLTLQLILESVSVGFDDQHISTDVK